MNLEKGNPSRGTSKHRESEVWTNTDLGPKKLCALNEGQKVVSNLCSYMNVGIFFGDGDLLDGLEAWRTCGSISNQVGDKWPSAILGGVKTT